MGDVAECAAFGGVSSGSRSHSAGINGNKEKKNRFRGKKPNKISHGLWQKKTGELDKK